MVQSLSRGLGFQQNFKHGSKFLLMCVFNPLNSLYFSSLKKMWPSKVFLNCLRFKSFITFYHMYMNALLYFKLLNPSYNLEHSYVNVFSTSTGNFYSFFLFLSYFKIYFCFVLSRENIKEGAQ